MQVHEKRLREPGQRMSWMPELNKLFMHCQITAAGKYCPSSAHYLMLYRKRYLNVPIILSVKLIDILEASQSSMKKINNVIILVISQ